MKICYYADKISPNIAMTPEGFMVCQNVPIARTGYQKYLESELFEDGDPSVVVNVFRSADEVFSPATLASFEGKPVTDGHPDVDVVPDNFHTYSRGHVQHVRIGKGDDADKIIADLYITDPDLIEEIQNGKREVSAGYYAEDKTDNSGRICQTCIRGNHVAVVDEGRAGRSVCIRDHKFKGALEMKNPFMKKILARVKKYYKDADPEEQKEVLADIDEIIDACKDGDEMEEEVYDAAGPDDEEDRRRAREILESELKKITELLKRAKKDTCDEDANVDIDEDVEDKDVEEEVDEDVEDEDIDADVDEGVEEEDIDSDVEVDENVEDEDVEEEVEVIPTDETEERLSAKDAVIKKISRAAAKIRDKQDRKRVQDAIRDAIRGKSQMKGVAKIVNKVRSTRDSGKDINTERLQKVYDKLNPHKGNK